MATVTTQVNTSGSGQVSDGDNDDLTKLVATLQSVVDSESESSKKHSQAVHHTTVVLPLESVGQVRFLQQAIVLSALPLCVFHPLCFVYTFR